MPRGMLVRVRLGTGTVALLLAASAVGCTGSDGSDVVDGIDAVDDEVTLYAGTSAGRLDPLANDRAPAGVELRMCGRTTGREDGLRYEYRDVPAYLGIDARPVARAGEHEIRYTACGGGERARATVRVTVLAVPDVTVTQVRPGVLRVTNPADVPVSLEYGHPNDDALPADGTLEVPAGGSRELRVQRHEIDWTASPPLSDEPTFRVSGTVSGIRLPPGVAPLPGPRAPGAT